MIDQENLRTLSPYGIILAAADAIRDLGSVPACHLYAVMCGVLTIDRFEAVICILIDAGLGTRCGDLLRWGGPKGGAVCGPSTGLHGL